MPAFNVILVQPEQSRLSDTSWKAVVDEVQAELTLLTRSAKSPAVRGGFRVVQRAEFPEAEVRKLAKTDFVVYCIHRRSLSKLTAKARKHLGLNGQETKDLAAKAKTYLDTNHGMTVRHNGNVVGFVPVDTYEGMGRAPMFSAEERTAMEVHAGREMAQLVLHELGHMVGHGIHTKKGLMRETEPVAMSPDAFEESHFSARSRRIILRKLRKLAK